MHKKRLTFFLIFVVISFFIILIRLVDIQIIHHSFYKKKAESQRRRIIPIATDRGDIYDRNGELLATSIDVKSIYVNPKEFVAYSKLENALDITLPRFSKKRLFAWVKRKVDSKTVQKIENLNLPGVYFLDEKKRIYPKGSLASQVLGFVGVDNEGLSGVELSMEDYLKGEALNIVTESDPAGYELLTKRESEKTKISSGSNIYLSIDESIQYFAEREIKKAVEKYSALSGLVIVMDTKSGEILAMAGKPDFNPNNYDKFSSKVWRCKALDIYEPGSTFKTITAAIGLNEGVIGLDSKFNALDKIVVGGKTIENSHKINWKGNRFCTLSYTLEQSINTAMVQIGLKLGKEKLYNGIKNFGFGDSVDVGLRGESPGIVRHFSYWYAPDIAMMTFGQSIAVTPLQLCLAYLAIGNKGELVKPALIKKIQSEDQKFVKKSTVNKIRNAISKKISSEVLELLENVVLKGSGRRAKIKGFRVGGKTGTAQKANPDGRGYFKDKYIASFIGLAPISDPKVLCLVVVDEPHGSIWGESVAGPVFQRVVEETLRYLNIKPDNLTGEAKIAN